MKKRNIIWMAVWLLFGCYFVVAGGRRGRRKHCARRYGLRVYGSKEYG